MNQNKTNHSHKIAFYAAFFVGGLVLSSFFTVGFLQTNEIQTSFLRVQNTQKQPVRDSRQEAEILLRDMQANFSKIQFSGLRSAMSEIENRIDALSQVRSALNEVLAADYRFKPQERSIQGLLAANNFGAQLDSVHTLIERIRFSEIETLLSFIDQKRAQVDELFAEWRGNFSLVFGGKVLYVANNAGSGGDFSNIVNILNQHFGETENGLQNISIAVQNIQNTISLARQQFVPGLDPRVVNLVNSFPLADAVPPSLTSLRDAISPAQQYRTALVAVKDDIIALALIIPAVLIR